MERLIPKRVQDVQKEMMRAIRYGLRASADLKVIALRSCSALGFAASFEWRSKIAPEELAPTRRTP